MRELMKEALKEVLREGASSSRKPGSGRAVEESEQEEPKAKVKKDKVATKTIMVQFCKCKTLRMWRCLGQRMVVCRLQDYLCLQTG